MAQINHLLYFEDEAVFANLLSRQLGLTATALICNLTVLHKPVAAAALKAAW